MRSLPLAIVLSAIATKVSAEELQINWDWALSATHHQLAETTLLEAKNNSHSQLDGLLDVAINYANWSSLLALYSLDLYQSGSHSWFDETDSRIIVRELAWQGSADWGDQVVDLSLGKIRLDYGVSYAYRPLDMFKPYRQNPIGLSIEEGAVVASASSFTATGEWTLLYTNSHWTDNQVSQFEMLNQQHGVGIRRFGLAGDDEYQWIAYYDDVRQGAIGASWVTVPTSAWEIHSELLWQNKTPQYSLPSNHTEPVTNTEAGSAWQALAGFTYTTHSGHSFIGEYWFDGRAWSDAEWQQARVQAEYLKRSVVTQPLAASYAQGLQHDNLMQHTLMLHWSWDPQTWLQWQGRTNWQWLEKITPKFDLLISPQDGGVIATQWLTYQWLDNGNQSVDLEFTARFLTGNDDSAYAQINQSHTLTFMIKGKF